MRKNLPLPPLSSIPLIARRATRRGHLTVAAMLLLCARCGPGPVDTAPQGAAHQDLGAAARFDAAEPLEHALDLGAETGGSRDLREPDAAAATGVQTGVTRCGVPDSCEFTTQRDAALWPFDACSPWNHPIGDGAQYQVISSPALFTRAGDVRTTAAINSAEWSHPVYVEDLLSGRSGTLSGMDEQGRMASYPLMLPKGMSPAAGSDGHLHVIAAGRRILYEMYQARWSGASIIATDLIQNDLYGPGVFDGAASPQGEIWHGVRAYGGSALGGLIRAGELAGPIRHALAVAVQRAAMNRSTPNRMGYVWPASCRDDGWERTYGTTGNLHMGSLLALVPSEDRAELFRREQITDPGVQVIAAALQDYGAYVVDATSDNLTFYAEPAETAAERLDVEQLARLLPYLRVIPNSDAEHVGGGGRARQCFAPAIQ